MKNIILGSVLAVVAVATLDANAAGTSTFCNNPNAAGNAIATAASGTDFIKVPFTPKCSANVILIGTDENALLFRVGSASTKGKSYFGGSSAGGAVARQGDCGASACDASKADAGRQAAPSS